MSRRSFSILLVFLAVIAIGVVWIVGGFGESTKGTQESAARAREASGARPTASPELAGLPVETAPQALPVEPEPSALHRTGAAVPESDRELADATWIDGRVIIPRGTPPDEQVVIVAEGLPFESRDFHRASPGPDGTFRVAFARDTKLGVLRLEGRYLYLKNHHVVTLPRKASEIVLRPTLGGCIRGRVLLPLSGDIARTSVIGSSVIVYTDSEGNGLFPDKRATLASTTVDETLEFELRGVPGVDASYVGLRAGEAWNAKPVEVKVLPGQVTTEDLLVEASARITGTVLDPDGQPALRSSVYLRRTDQPRAPENSSYPDRNDSADSEGRYELRGLPAGAYEVWAGASHTVNSAPTKLDLVPGQIVTDLTLRLSRGGRIAGEVIDASDRPEPGVYLHASTSGGQRSVTTSTDGQGKFEFGELVPGEYVLKTGRPGSSWTSSPTRGAVVQVEDGQTAQVVISWNREQSIVVQGTVRLGGEPAAGWRVRATPMADMADEPRSTTCEANGAYRLGLGRAGWFAFEVEAPEGTTNLTESVQLPFAKNFEKDFDLFAKGRIAGRVVDGNGAALRSVVVNVAPDGGFEHFGGRSFFGEHTTDALGAFAFEGVPAGTYRLDAHARFGEGTASQRGSLAGIRVDEDEAIEGLTLTVQESCSLEVSLRRDDGKVVPNASVQAIGQGSYSQSWSSSSSTQGPSRYELTGLRPGEVTVSASSDDPPLAGSSTVVLSPGEKGKVEVVLRPATVLLVRIGASGRDPRDVVVCVRDARGVLLACRFDDPSPTSKEENASERSFGAVSTGHYTVYAEHPDGSSARSEIEVTGASRHIVLLSLQP